MYTLDDNDYPVTNISDEELFDIACSVALGTLTRVKTKYPDIWQSVCTRARDGGKPTLADAMQALESVSNYLCGTK